MMSEVIFHEGGDEIVPMIKLGMFPSAQC